MYRTNTTRSMAANPSGTDSHVVLNLNRRSGPGVVPCRTTNDPRIGQFADAFAKQNNLPVGRFT